MAGVVNILSDVIRQYALSLEDLVVYTEAASGSYSLCPILAALAGAKLVYAQVNESRFASIEEVRVKTNYLAKVHGVEDRIKVLPSRDFHSLAQADIVTNSGFVRPIDRALIESLKSTAVIPLMWETWEFRKSDFDLDCCKEKGIVVLGTDENKPPCRMDRYIGLMALKLLFELGYDGGRILVIGDPPLPAPPMVEYMRKVGLDVVWVSSKGVENLDYKSLNGYFLKEGSSFDCMIIADHKFKGFILGSDGILSIDVVKEVSPFIKIGVVCGGVNEKELKISGLSYFPSVLAPIGFMSYQPYFLGPRPVLELFGAGLKVGELMARSRISGMSVVQTVEHVLAISHAMDFQGDLSWL